MLKVREDACTQELGNPRVFGNTTMRTLWSEVEWALRLHFLWVLSLIVPKEKVMLLRVFLWVSHHQYMCDEPLA